MGIDREEREREREREMYLIVLLLIASAFGRPNSAQLDVDSNIEENILQLSIELSQSEGEGSIEARRYFEKYQYQYFETKSYLKQTRQELRELAKRTLSDERSLTLLLDGIDKSPATATQVTLLKIVIANMEDLTIETQEKLKAAREKYNSVHQASDNLQEAVAYSIQHTRLSGRTRILNRDIDGAIDVLTEEIDQISYWTNRAEVVNNSIDDYPAELLVEFKAIRNAFKTTLVDLKYSAKRYLDQAE